MLILICLPFFSLSQPMQTLTEKTLNESGLIYTNYVKSNGQVRNYVGGGFFIKGEYFVTCYHNYTVKPGEKRKSVTVYYHIKLQNGKVSADSVSAYLDQNPLPRMYNFYNHSPVNLQQISDVIVLRLVRKINTDEIVYCKNNCATDSLICFGSIRSGRDQTFRISVCKFLFPYQMDPQYSFSAISGEISEGFSGSPVFNKRNELVGMLQAGWDSVEQLMQKGNLIDIELSKKRISNHMVDHIKNGYKNNLKMGSMININELKRNYLNGYLK